MALVNIGGVDLPAPASYNVTITDITKNDRNAAGTMIIERIATKRAIQLGWNYLSGDDYSNVLNAVTNVFFTVTYFDPQNNTNQTGTFYCSDRQAGMIQFTNGVPSWSNVSVHVNRALGGNMDVR
jgi:hypothetical protein